MPGTVSSAEPDQLFAFFHWAKVLDDELAGEQDHITACMERFREACKEYRVDVAEADLLGTLRGTARPYDYFVWLVGEAFRVAELAWLGGLITLGIIDLTPAMAGIYLSIVADVDELASSVEGWLLEKLAAFHLPTAPGGGSEVEKAIKAAKEARERQLLELKARYPLGMPPVAGVSTPHAVAAKGQPVQPELTSTPGARSREMYDAVINQFGVATNKRYEKDRYLDKDGNEAWKTYCNIFAWDVTAAMGVEIPHYLSGEKGYSFKDRPKGAVEMQVWQVRDWLHSSDNKQWTQLKPAEDKPDGTSAQRKSVAQQAQDWANLGKPVVVLDDDGTHIGVIRPGDLDPDRGPCLAQAGWDNFDGGHVMDGFGTSDDDSLQYWVAE